MRKIVFLVTLAVSLFSTTILDEYRKNGLENIEKKLDKALTKTKYWEEVISKEDIKFGYIEKYNYILVCDKSKSQLTLYQKDKNNKFVLKNKYSAFTGKNKGDKQKEGDLRTPVGIYNLVKKLKKIDSFYGPLAFVTSYPNLYDRYRGKNGHGIWIHGLPLNQERDEYTKGCIAIDNDGLKCLEKDINFDKTILLIYETKKIKDTNIKKLSILASNLYKWRYAWKYNDIDSYLSFYDKNFKKDDGKDFQQFKKYKTRVFKKNEKKSIIFKDINIIPYPNAKQIYQITFFEDYKSDTYMYKGQKELLVKFQDNSFKIISEK